MFKVLGCFSADHAALYTVNRSYLTNELSLFSQKDGNPICLFSLDFFLKKDENIPIKYLFIICKVCVFIVYELFYIFDILIKINYISFRFDFLKISK